MENYATYKGPCEEHLLAVMSLASARLDTDTDELIDWVFGTELEDTASEKDTASVEDNDELGNSSITCKTALYYDYM